MSGETTCPTCGSPCTEETIKRDLVINAGSLNRSTTETVYHTTAADPARLESLLRNALTDIDDDFDGFSSWRMDVLRFFGMEDDGWG